MRNRAWTRSCRSKRSRTHGGVEDPASGWLKLVRTRATAGQRRIPPRHGGVPQDGRLADSAGTPLAAWQRHAVDEGCPHVHLARNQASTAKTGVDDLDWRSPSKAQLSAQAREQPPAW
jgi:hypothetical protein